MTKLKKTFQKTRKSPSFLYFFIILPPEWPKAEGISDRCRTLFESLMPPRRGLKLVIKRLANGTYYVKIIFRLPSSLNRYPIDTQSIPDPQPTKSARWDEKSVEVVGQRRFPLHFFQRTSGKCRCRLRY